MRSAGLGACSMYGDWPVGFDFCVSNDPGGWVDVVLQCLIAFALGPVRIGWEELKSDQRSNTRNR